MIWNSIPNEERLRLWKKLRNDITNYSDSDRLSELAKFCSTIPFGSRTLDYYSSEDWPTPWEILFYGSFCTSSISLLMFYTLTLIDDPTTVDLILVEDDDGTYLLPLIDNQYVLNYELGKVNIYSEIQDNFKLLKIFPKEQIKNIT
jgi:hypothetical protein